VSTKTKKLKGNQHGPVGLIGGKTWEELKAKHAQHEGTRLPKSSKPPLILTRQRESTK
jgi:hypothetical protein